MYKFQPVLELLRRKSLSDIRKAFGEDEGVDLDTFTESLRRKLRLDVKEWDAHHLFHQIDRYAKEKITAAQLCDYLIAYEKKRLLPSEGPFEDSPSIYPGVRSQDSIVQWILYPEEPEMTDEMAGHYVFVSRNGILSVWSKDMMKRFETSIETADDGGPGKTWATGLACMPREKLLAVSTTAGDIRFFRSSIYKFEHRFSIVCLPNVVLRLACHDSDTLVCGDFTGAVYAVRMSGDFCARYRRRASHLRPEKLAFAHAKAGRIAGLSHLGTAKAHLGPVQQVEYVPALNAVISCSMSTKRAMMVHFLEKGQSLGFRSEDGICCFAFCRRLNCIVTGGADHEIKVWDPTVNTSSNESLAGHGARVTHVLVMEERLLLVSCDRDNVVRVWDLLRPGCLQVIGFRESGFPDRRSFASMFLDPVTGSLIFATYRVGRLEPLKKPIREKTHPCGEYVVLAAHSGVYDCTVTVGDSGSVCVWDGPTGRLIYEYERSHEVSDGDGFPRNVLVTTASLDPSGRRLVTADRSGAIKVWNFHLGLCLRSLEAARCGTVLSLCLLGSHVYAGGTTGRVVHLYDDGGEGVEPVPFDGARHGSSVVGLDWHGRSLLASSSCDGEIVVWLRRSGVAKIRLRDMRDEDSKEVVEADEQFLARSQLVRRRRYGVGQILFLRRRETDALVGNLVSCGTDGRIRFWNVVSTRRENRGRILSRFRAVFGDRDGVLCLATDPENHYLISGDTVGYVRVYDIQDYYSAYGSAPPGWTGQASPQQAAKFAFLRLRGIVDRNHPEHSKFPAGGGSELGHAPFLLNCFRAHVGAVLRTEYVCGKDTILTAGGEGSVRLWTLSGVYAGCLGPSDEPWGLDVGDDGRRRMPPDVRAVASSFTLFVMNNGNVPHWIRALNALKNCRLGHRPEDFTEKPLRWRFKKSSSAENPVPNQRWS